jgi:hypothetical protein
MPKKSIYSCNETNWRFDSLQRKIVFVWETPATILTHTYTIILTEHILKIEFVELQESESYNSCFYRWGVLQ